MIGYSIKANIGLLNGIFTLQMYANYDDMEIGALECDDIEGEIDINSPLFQMAAKEFEKERQQVFYYDFQVLKNYTFIIIIQFCLISIGKIDCRRFERICDRIWRRSR